MRGICCFISCIVYVLNGYSQSNYKLTIPGKYIVDTVSKGSVSLYKYHILNDGREIFSFSSSSILGASTEGTYRNIATKGYRDNFLKECDCNITRQSQIILANDTAILFETNFSKGDTVYYSYVVSTVKNQRFYSFIFYAQNGVFNKFKERFIDIVKSIEL